MRPPAPAHGEDRAAAIVDGEQAVAIGLGQSRLVEKDRAGRAAAAVIGEGLDDLVGEVDEQRRIAVFGRRDDVAEADVPAAAVVGVVAREQVQVGVDGDVVDVAQARRR